MNGKELKKSINSIMLSEESKERIISKLERITPDEVRKTNSEEYTEFVLNVEPAKKPILHYAMTVASACAVLAVSVVGVYIFNREGFGPAMEFTEEINDIDEDKSIASEEFDSFLSEYNQEHGTGLRFPTEDECIEVGTTRNDCFEFFSQFPDKESFLQYVEILARKGETIISSFHRINLHENGDKNAEITGYYYFPYNASGQTYGIVGNVDGLCYSDIPDLFGVITLEGSTGYVKKEEVCLDSASGIDESRTLIDHRRREALKDNYSPLIINAYDTDGQTIVGHWNIGHYTIEWLEEFLNTQKEVSNMQYEEINEIDENNLTPQEEFDSFLLEYNQEHGSELRFPTEDECIKAGTTMSACFEFFSQFPDKESFLQYVDILAGKGETIISSFHRTNLYEDCNDSDSEVIGYYYYPYNASGQTYGITGIDGLRIVDEPDLIAIATNEGTTGYAMKAEVDAVDSASTPEEANKIMEERKKAIENGTYSPVILNAYDTDGKTIVGTFTIGSLQDVIYNMQN